MKINEIIRIRRTRNLARQALQLREHIERAMWQLSHAQKLLRDKYLSEHLATGNPDLGRVMHEAMDELAQLLPDTALAVMRIDRRAS